MPHLLDLANEIHYQIWDYIVTPEDIQSFASVCKVIYALAEPALREYHRLRRYSCVTLWREERESPPADLLESLIRDRRISLYVEEMVVHGWAFGYDDSEVPGHSHPPTIFHDNYSPEHMDLFVETSQVGLWDDTEDCDRFDWQKSTIQAGTAIQGGDEEPILAMILPRLPRLKTLRFPMVGSISGFLAMSISAIIDHPATNALSMLTKLVLEEPDPLGDYSEEWLPLINIFAGLPSLRTIEAFGIHDVESMKYERRNSREIEASHLTDIAFHDCFMCDDWLSDLLNFIKALKSFCYTQHSSRVIWLAHRRRRAFMIAGTLSIFASSSLESLTLHSGGREWWQPVRELRCYEVLKELSIDYHLLLGCWEHPNGQKLQKMLPKSIEKVKLHCWDMTNLEEVEEVVLGLVAEKKDELPLFKSLELDFMCNEDGGQAGDQERWKVGVYRGNMAAIRELKKACADVELELKIKGHFLHWRPFTSNKARYVTTRSANNTQDDCWPPFFRHTHSLPGEYAMAPF